jgi:hypothetical protein
MRQPDLFGLCRCGLCSWEGQFRALLVRPNERDEFQGLYCPQCQELGYIEFKFDCEAEPHEIIGHIPKQLPPPKPTAFDNKVRHMAPYEAMVYSLASWFGCRPDKDAISEVVYEGVDDATVEINWRSSPAQIELYTTAGEGEEEIRTRPLKWPFTEEQLQRAMVWLVKQARRLNEQELRNQRR